VMNTAVFFLFVFGTVLADPGNGIWRRISPKGDVPSNRGASSLTSFGEKAYLFAGFEEILTDTPQVTINTFFNDLFELNLNSGRFTKLSTTGPTPSPRGFHCAFKDPLTASFYVFGGANYDFTQGTFDAYNDMSRFNINTNSWETIHPTNEGPSPRLGSACAVFDSKVVVHGGVSLGAFGFDPHGDTWVYDIPSNSWTQINGLGDVPSARYFHSAGNWVAGGNKLIIMNGESFVDGDFLLLTDAYEYDFNTNTWTRHITTGPPLNQFQQTGTMNIVDNRVIFQTDDFGDAVPDLRPTTCIYHLDTHVYQQLSLTGDDAGPAIKRVASCLFNNKMFIVTGWGYTNGQQFWDRNVYSYSYNNAFSQP